MPSDRTPRIPSQEGAAVSQPKTAPVPPLAAGRVQLEPSGHEHPRAEAPARRPRHRTSCRSPAATRTTRPGTKATRMPEAARASGFVLTGAMLGFPGEDYTTPADDPGAPAASATPPTGPSGSNGSHWALDRTVALGPHRPDAARRLPARAGRPRPQAVPRHARPRPASSPAEKGITLAFETGQETADLLRRTLDELKAPT